MQENEIKYTICKQDYLKLKTIFEGKECIRKTQVNYYYDTKNMDLNKSNITFRIRQTEDELKLQLKYPMGTNGHIIQKLEKEAPINKLTKEINLKQVELELGVQGLSQYGTAQYLGELVTHRISFYYNEWLKLELDANYYLGETDYEIEIEIETGREEEAKKIVNELFGNSFEYTKYGKIKRFISRYKMFFKE